MTVRFEFFQELGDFYEANGYFGMSHSRIRRCEILLEFLALYLHGCDRDAITSVVLSENAGDRDNTDFDENAIDRDSTDFDEMCVDLQHDSGVTHLLICTIVKTVRSRPRWATDIGSFKHMTHAYCKNGKLSYVNRSTIFFRTSTRASWMSCQSIIRSRCGRFSTTT